MSLLLDVKKWTNLKSPVFLYLKKIDLSNELQNTLS